jgi:hypothetical protein
MVGDDAEEFAALVNTRRVKANRDGALALADMHVDL